MYACSDLATTITPVVPTSRRCTMPCRSAAPRGGRSRTPSGGEPAEDRRARPAGAGVGRDPDRLVDHHDVVVVVEDLEPGDDLGRRGDGGRPVRLGQVDLEPAAGDEPVGLAGGLAVDRDPARPRRGSRPRCGRGRAGATARRRPASRRGRRARGAGACHPRSALGVVPCGVSSGVTGRGASPPAGRHSAARWSAPCHPSPPRPSRRAGARRGCRRARVRSAPAARAAPLR